MYLLGAAAALVQLQPVPEAAGGGAEPGTIPRSMDHTGGRVQLYRNHNRGFCFEVLKHRPSLVRRAASVPDQQGIDRGVLCFLSSFRRGTGRKRRDMPWCLQGTSAIVCDRLETGLCGRLLQHFRRILLK